MDQTGATEVDQGPFLQNPFKDMDPSNVNVKKIRKLYQRQFEMFRSTCRMKITGKHKSYDQYSKQILDLFSSALKDLNNITNGNIVVLTFVIDDLFRTLSELSHRIQGVQDIELLESGHDIALKKQGETVKMLTDNLRTPVTLDEFESYLHSEGVVDGQSNDAETTRG